MFSMFSPVGRESKEFLESHMCIYRMKPTVDKKKKVHSVDLISYLPQ
jgi:hypothetical protein